MKKDHEIEKAFEEYFGAASYPDERVTQRAKEAVNAKKRRNKMLARVLTAAACCALICGGAVAISYLSPKNNIQPAPPIPPTADLHPTGTGLQTAPLTNFTGENAPAGLGFAQALALSSNCAVNKAVAYCADGEVVIAEFSVSGTANGFRHDAVICAEYSDGVYDRFADYLNGQSLEYRGVQYRLATLSADGEYEHKLCLTADGVKYYVSVKSSDENAYLFYVKLLAR